MTRLAPYWKPGEQAVAIALGNNRPAERSVFLIPLDFTVATCVRNQHTNKGVFGAVSFPFCLCVVKGAIAAVLYRFFDYRDFAWMGAVFLRGILASSHGAALENGAPAHRHTGASCAA